MNIPIKNKKFVRNDKCIEWTGAKSGNGYGVISFHKKNYYLHRLFYRIFIGEIENDLLVLHRCDNPSCVNPEHLFKGTQLDNVNDMIKKNRRNLVSSQNEKNGNTKFSNQVIKQMRTDFLNGLSKKSICELYGISGAQAYRILNNKARKNI